MFAFILLSSTILIAFGQVPTQQYIKKLENEGKFNCEIWQINEFFYKPIRINMVHEPVLDTSVSVQSGDPESDVFWEGSKQTFQLVTDSPDRFDIEIILDYEVKHEDPRQVFYQIYAQDNVLMMEGNWVHEGFTFCKVISFSTQDPPHILTSDEIQEENNKFNADFRKEVAESNTSVHNALLLIAIVVLLIGIFVGLVFFIIIVSLKSMGKIGQKPVKKLLEMIELIRTVSENLKMVSDHLITTDSRTKNQVVTEVNRSLRDVQIVLYGAKEAIEELSGKKIVLESPPTGTKTVESKSPSFKDTVVVKRTDAEEVEIEKDIAKLMGVEYKKTPEHAEKESEKILKDAEVIEMKIKDVKPCKVCGKPPNLICSKCKNFFCEKHLKHGCDIPETKPKKTTKDTIKIITNKAKVMFFEDKLPSITDDEGIQNELDKGTKIATIERALIKEYMKIPRNDNLYKFEDMQKDQHKKMSDAKAKIIAIKINALLLTLNRQVQ